ncbi:Hypothetical predicted protein [Cloeon dipterum]|uniref:Reverse transcriptase domain-containing protein n=1 Tax=Cloeon dipterum TaxID=197152 RepID=A0A8S1D214_9INSE|nr:Hypothetical predicted protein [Cloeon dipterum]
MLDVKSATGPYGIPAILLKNCAATLCPSLTHILQLSLRASDLPMEWKMLPSLPCQRKRLLNKLQFHGVDGAALKWLKKFFVGRSRFVRFNSAHSEPCEATSGVIQGSCLGPLLFNIFVSDLPSVVETNLVRYADDCTMYNKIDTEDDIDVLQEDLSRIDIWCMNNGMKLNGKKCVVMDISRARLPATRSTQSAARCCCTLPRSGFSVCISRGICAGTTTSMSSAIKAMQTLGFAARNLRGCTQRASIECAR